MGGENFKCYPALRAPGGSRYRRSPFGGVSGAAAM
jgi:hypothetical protein